jgi:ParB family chromosome partitioning protein
MMAFAHDARSELVRENEELRTRASETDRLRAQLGDALTDLAQWDGAKAARLLDPRLVVASVFANRHSASFEDADYAVLKAEIENAGGNVQPIKVRALLNAPAGQAQYELVFGHRRHRACLDLGLPVLAVVDNLDDRALFVEMERENRARKDLSAWEQGRMYRRALTQGLFSSNRKLAQAVGVDLSALGKALSLADLPDWLVAAFPSPLGLQFRWAKPLNDRIAAEPAVMAASARSLAERRGELTAKQVFEHLMNSGSPQGVEPFHPPEPCPVFRNGQMVGQLRIDERGAASLHFVPGLLNPQQAPELADWLTQFFSDPRSGQGTRPLN